jgi:1,6-anhydro-N-acetylmuramate kinase
VASAVIPHETRALFGQLTSLGPKEGDFDSAGRIASLSAQLAEIEAPVVGELLGGPGAAQRRPLAVGVHDPGLWSCGRPTPGGYLSLCDAARLAELTDANVIDAFPARDVARGGQGGPLTALPEWILLRSDDRHRVVLDLGRTVRMTYLPRDCGNRSADWVRSFDVGPGTQMLDLLVDRLGAWEYWKSSVDGVNAFLLWRGQHDRIDRERLERRIARVGWHKALQSLIQFSKRWEHSDPSMEEIEQWAIAGP